MKYLLWTSYALVTLLLSIALIYVLGRRLPREHQVHRQIDLAVSIEQARAKIWQVQAYTTWRQELRQVTVLEQDSQRILYRERGPHGDMLFELISLDANHLVSKIADPKLPFSGQWDFVLSQNGAQCRLRITETGAVNAPIWRFFSYYVFGQETSLKRFSAELQRSFASQPVSQ